MKYVLEFSILPGKAKEFWNFMNEKGIPFWQKQDEVESVEIYTTLGGHSLYEAHFDLPNYATFDRLQQDPEFERVSVEFLSLVNGLRRKFLTEERKVVQH